MSQSNAKKVDNMKSGSDVLQHAEELILELQRGNEEKVNNILESIHAVRESNLFREVGKMTRQLHDALESFRRDSRIDALASEEIPNARERLSYVITMTQQAADRTLSAVENTMPMAQSISEKSVELSKAWAKFRNRKLTASEFRRLAEEIDVFLKEITDDSTILKNNLNDVLMAQDFQDLTGQIIKRVITLVEEVEGNLVELIRITGDKLGGSIVEETKTEKDITPEGPQIPGIGKNKDVVNSQDDVDDLLSSLGF